MRLLTLILFTLLFACVFSKINPKALTESHGQEVIEIGSPLKELPPDIEEEPSAEIDDDLKSTNTTTITVQPATKKETKKSSVIIETRRKGKDIDKIDGVIVEDEDARIEKELAEIYKDNSDYKSEGSEEGKKKQEAKTTLDTTTSSIQEETKPIARSRENFKFQPDVDNKAAVERFRTSVDEISCDRGVTKKLDIKTTPDSGVTNSVNIYLFGIVTLFNILCYNL